MDRRWDSQRLTRSENGPCGPIGRVGGSPHTPSLSEQATRCTTMVPITPDSGVLRDHICTTQVRKVNGLGQICYGWKLRSPPCGPRCGIFKIVSAHYDLMSSVASLAATGSELSGKQLHHFQREMKHDAKAPLVEFHLRTRQNRSSTPHHFSV